MKKTLFIITILIAMAAMSSCSRHHSDSTASTDAGQRVSNAVADFTNSATDPTHTNFVRVAVVKTETVERIRSLFTEAGIKVTVEKIVVPDGSFHAFPLDSYKISVPQGAQAKALALIREDAPKGKYWIQAGSVLDSIDPPHTNLEPAATNP